jgi:hypothetical protein
VLVIRSVDPDDVVPNDQDLTPEEWSACCRERGVVAFAAEQDGEPVGFAVAESDPHALHVVELEGDAGTCRVLLDRLVRLAGERDMSGWVPAGRPALRQLVERLGFVRLAGPAPGGSPSFLYYWSRNDNT